MKLDVNAAESWLIGRKVLIALLFTAVLLVADRLTFLHPIGPFNITPWNPPAAMLVALLWTLGLGWSVWAYISLLIADTWVRDLVWWSWGSVVGNALLVVCYAAIAWVLKQRIKVNLALSSRSDLAWFIVICTAGPILTATLYVGAQVLFGGLSPALFLTGVFQFFVGDLLGLMVILPLVLLWRDPGRRREFVVMARQWAFWTRMGVLALSVLVLLSAPVSLRTVLFFPLFFILGLISVAHGTMGAAVASVAVQFPLVLGSGPETETAVLLELQFAMLFLHITSLVIGSMVDERGRIQAALRENLQLAAAGSLAGSLAHELHQPLSALSAYAESALMLADPKNQGNEANQALLNKVLRQIVDETLRASQIVRGLRSYFIAGAANLQTVQVAEWADDCLSRCQNLAIQQLVTLRLEVHTQRQVVIDPIQVGTALANLVKNAIEASPPHAQVTIACEDDGIDEVRISVYDEGPVLDPQAMDDIFRPLYTSKRYGLGLGLSISKSLIENNGGELKYVHTPKKCLTFNLPALEKIYE